MSEAILAWNMPTVSPRTSFPCFRAQAMAQWDCDETAYLRRVFWRALPRMALPVAGLIWLVHRPYFARDLALIHELGQTRDASEFHYLVEQFRDEVIRSGGWERNALRLRVSGRRLRRLRWELR
jgi:hypothetical protein